MPKLTVTLIFISSLMLFGCSSPTKEEKAQLPEAIVDRIALVDLDGNALSLDTLKGKTIFINYWATWCRPCIAEMPDIDAAAKILEGDDFVFLAASDEAIDKIRNYVDQVDFSFQFVRSETSVFDLDIKALPTTMIIDKQGNIVYNEAGAKKWNSDTEINKLKEIASK